MSDLERLLEQAAAASPADYPTAILLLSEHLDGWAEDAVQTLAERGSVDALLGAAHWANQHMRRELSVPWIDRAKALAVRPERRAFASMAGIFACLVGARFEDARLWALEAHQHLAVQQSPLLLAQILAGEGVALRHLGRHEESIIRYSRALEQLASVEGDFGRSLESTVHNNLAVLYSSNRDIESAERHYRAAYALQRVEDGGKNLVMSRYNLGRLLARRGKLDEAGELFAEGIEAASTLGPGMLALGWQAMASLRVAQGRPREAVRLLNDAVAQFRTAPRPFVTGQALLERGRVLREAGEPGALADFDESLAIAVDVGQEHFEMQVSLELARCHRDAGNFEESAHYFERVVALQDARYDSERLQRLEECKARHRVEEAEQALSKALVRAEEASRAKSGFLSVTSHELRTPLHAIIGFTELLLDDVEADETPASMGQDLQQIHVAAKKLQRLIGRILTLVSLGDGTTPVHPVEVDVAAHLVRLTDEIRPAVELRGNQLVLEVEESVGAVMVDPELLSAILQHLLDNANDFSSNGVITLRCKRDDALRIEVEDKGPGFDTAQFDVLTQPFSQLDMSYTRVHEGLGLGLALCAHQCRLLAGELTSDSTYTDGARFRVVLPL